MKRRKSGLAFAMVLLLAFSFPGAGLADDGDDGRQREDREEIRIEFKDAGEAEWAITYIGKMKAKNVLSGYPDGTFQPNKPVKRVEAITAAVRLMGLEEEAKAVPADTRLLFKDADQIDDWAVGYIKVALENGLFDETADKVEPNKPASRVWMAALLVKALGLQDEALGQMNVAPDFKDAAAIPAGSVGYVNVAVEEGLISGYPDGTFRPNKSVTRAELAALLDRTNYEFLEQEGAVMVSGTVEGTNFTSVTDDVYGTVTLRTFQGDVRSYLIEKDLPVMMEDGFITADQLAAGDTVTLIVKDGHVIEASLVSGNNGNILELGIIKLEFKAEFPDGSKYELEYQNYNGQVKGEIKTDLEQNTGDLEQITALLTEAALTPNMTAEEITAKLFDALEISQAKAEEIKLEVLFSNGMKLEWESGRDGDDDSGWKGGMPAPGKNGRGDDRDDGREDDDGRDDSINKRGKGKKSRDDDRYRDDDDADDEGDDDDEDD